MIIMATRFITVKGRHGKRAVPVNSKGAVCPVRVDVRLTGMKNLKSAVIKKHKDRLYEMLRKMDTAEGLAQQMQWAGKQYAGDEDTQRDKLTRYLRNQYENSVDEDVHKITEIEGAKDFSGELVVTVEWKKSRMWGNNPTATTNYGHDSGSIGGCGYDKESTAIANVLNEHLPLMKLLYAKKDKDYRKWKGQEDPNKYNRAVLGYGSGYNILPHFEGGVGVSSHQRIIENLGLEMKNISSGKVSDVYIIRKKRSER